MSWKLRNGRLAMASKRRLRRRQCTNKMRHADEEAAKVHARALKRSGYLCTWYKCDFCSGWHVGRASKKRRQQLRAKRKQKILQGDP